MEDNWESHMSPLMMGVGMSEIGMSGQDLHQELGHPDQMTAAGGSQEYYQQHQDGGYSFSTKELLVSGQPTTTTTSGSSPSSGGGLSPGGGATVLSAGGALSPGGSSSGPPTGAQCCESGRPLVTDPVTGQSVCSCQYDSARLAALQYRNAASMYGAPYPSTDQNPYPSIGVDSSAFYSPLSNPYALKDASSAADMSAWTSAGLQPTTGYYPYDPTLAAYGYGAGYDLAARRKNATRESTATLKAWLNEHKKNPYPTKGEKIMLAIITKMTLTQVSTWFANARRRLKKENKMTWEPKNKTDDDDDAMVSDGDDKEKDDDDKRDETDIHGRIKSERSCTSSSGKDLDCCDDGDMTDDDRKDDILLGGGAASMHHLLGNGPYGGGTTSLKAERTGSTDCGVPLPPSKPKIWSLADTAACKTPPPPPPSHQQQHWLTNGFALPSSRYQTGAGAGGTGFLSTHCQQAGFPDVLQTDTPPQTPPSMKLGSNGGLQQQQQQPQQQQSSTIGGSSANNPGYTNAAGFLQGGFNRLQSPHRAMQGGGGGVGPPQQQMILGSVGQDGAAGFKPFYKSSQTMNGGFVSPV